jgi:hypothetical protein
LVFGKSLCQGNAGLLLELVRHDTAIDKDLDAPAVDLTARCISEGEMERLRQHAFTPNEERRPRLTTLSLRRHRETRVHGQSGR